MTVLLAVLWQKLMSRSFLILCSRRMSDLKISKRVIALILFFGFFVGFGSGLIENPDASNYPQEIVYYGFPLGWRSVNNGEKFAYPLELFVDILFGIAIVSLVATSYLLTQRWVSKKATKPANATQQNPRTHRFCTYRSFLPQLIRPASAS
jgi:hypothetical protein